MIEILNKITEKYGLGDVLDFSKIEEGALNENFLIATIKGKYFLKGIRSKAKERSNYIYNVERFMSENGIPAICRITDTDGQHEFIYDDACYTVYPFIDSDRSHIYIDADYERMGELLGKIHKVGNSNIPDNLKIHPFKITSQENKTKILNDYKDQIIRKDVHDSIDELFISYINLKLDSLEKLEDIGYPESDTLIHGDYHAGNLLFDKDSREIVGICDWEKTEYSPRAYELARSIFYICFSLGFNEDKGFNDAIPFVRGYMKSFPISKELLIEGLRLRLRQTGLSTWLEDGYYKDGNPKNNKFIQNEMELIKLFIFGDGLSRLSKLI